MALELLIGGCVAALATLALLVLRRERRRPNSVPSFMVGIARGLAVAVPGWIALTILIRLVVDGGRT
jgi:hypothetical protein